MATNIQPRPAWGSPGPHRVGHSNIQTDSSPAIESPPVQGTVANSSDIPQSGNMLLNDKKLSSSAYFVVLVVLIIGLGSLITSIYFTVSSKGIISIDILSEIFMYLQCAVALFTFFGLTFIINATFAKFTGTALIITTGVVVAYAIRNIAGMNWIFGFVFTIILNIGGLSSSLFWGYLLFSSRLPGMGACLIPADDLPPEALSIHSSILLLRSRAKYAKTVTIGAVMPVSTDHTESSKPHESIPMETPTKSLGIATATAACPYFCPICMLYYPSIFITKCCDQNICSGCIMGWASGKHGLPGRLNKLPEQLPSALTCPFCAVTGFEYRCLHPMEGARVYEDSPAVTRAKNRIENLNSPLHIGASYEEMKRKMIGYDTDRGIPELKGALPPDGTDSPQAVSVNE